MCWKTSENSQDSLTKRTADEDLVVYKVLRSKENGRLLSYFNEFEYAPGEWYSINKDLVIYDEGNENRTISEGFHSYDRKCNVEMRFFDGTIDIHGINWGYRNTALNTRYDRYDGRSNDDIVIAKCVIPIGSKYYENMDGEIVSDWIRLTKDYISYNKLSDYALRRSPNVMTFDQIFECLNVNE